MRRAPLPTVAFVTLLALHASVAAQPPARADGFDCFAVIAGRGATADGSVLFAHNEDSGEHPTINHWKVPRRSHPDGAVVRLVRGGEVPQVRETFAYVWSQMPGFHYSDAYLNEHGVALASNACRSRVTKPALEHGGIGYMLRRLVAERARTAREGVTIATALLDRFGYADSGRTLTIADPNEAWLLCICHGKHWVAARVPDDRFVAIANAYPIHEVDADDPSRFVLSDGLIEHARTNGWYDPERDGAFDFTVAYSAPKNRLDARNYRRQWRALSLLAAEPVAEDWRLPAFVAPKEKLTPAHLMRVVRDHYEETVYDRTDGYRTGSPNATEERTICTRSTINSIVFQLRPKMPVAIGALAWISMRRPDGSVFLPWYAGIDDVPPFFALGDADRALDTHFTQAARARPQPPSFKVFADVCRTLEADYARCFPQVRATRERLEATFFALQRATEQTARELHDADPARARAFLTAYTAGQTGVAIRAFQDLHARLHAPATR